MGLNEPVRGQILLMDPLPKINKVFALVLQEEQQWGDKIQQGVLQTFHVPSCHQLADIFTKPVGFDSFHRLITKMGILNLYTPS